MILFLFFHVESSPPKGYVSPRPKRLHLAINGDAPRLADDRETGDGAGKSVFSIGDSDSDSIGSQGGQVRGVLFYVVYTVTKVNSKYCISKLFSKQF